MQITRQNVSRNGNQGGAGKARSQSVPGRFGLGHPVANTEGLREKSASAPGVGNDHATANPQHSHGGHVNPAGFFGTTRNDLASLVTKENGATKADAQRRAISAVRFDRRNIIQLEAPSDNKRKEFLGFHADFARRCAGAGYVEATLALEGN